MSEWLAPQQSLPGQDHTGGHTVWVRPERLLEMARRQFSDCGHVDFLWLMMCTTMFNILFYWVVLSNLVQRSVHGCIYVIKGIAIGGHWCPLNHTQWVLKSSFTQKVTYRIKKKRKKEQGQYIHINAVILPWFPAQKETWFEIGTQYH